MMLLTLLLLLFEHQMMRKNVCVNVQMELWRLEGGEEVSLYPKNPRSNSPDTVSMTPKQMGIMERIKRNEERLPKMRYARSMVTCCCVVHK